MVERRTVPAHWPRSLRWSAAAILTVALAFGAAHTAHASTRTSAHTSMHTATCHPDKKICDDPGAGVATPELPSGELMALGLLPVLGMMLYRRSRRRSGT